MQPKFLKVWKSQAINELDVEASFVDAAIAGYHNQIRYGDSVTTKARLIVEVEQVAREYGAQAADPADQTAISLQKSILTECLKIIYSKFSFLAVDEIREAFRRWSVSNHPDKPKMFGRLTAAFFGEVLRLYMLERAPIIKRYLADLEAQKEKEVREARAEKMREGFEDRFLAEIEKAKAEQWDWLKIPAWWYESANERNMLPILSENEKRPYWERAQKAARAQLALERDQLKDRVQRMDLTRAIESGDAIKERAINIAKKMILEDHLINVTKLIY